MCLDAERQRSAAARRHRSRTSARTSTSAYQPNPNLQPGIVPYDLTRGGSLFDFHGNAQHQSVRVLRSGLRSSWAISRSTPACGTTSTTAWLRRTASSRAWASRTSFTQTQHGAAGGLRADVRDAVQREPAAFERHRRRRPGAECLRSRSPTPIQPGRRNQFNAGLQQAIGRWLIVDADYFWKYTHNAYDFSVLFNTPITFPIAWHNSKLDGVTARVSTIDLHGFQAYMTFGHTRARYFPPEVGGLIPLGGFAGGVFRIDHDQAYQQTVDRSATSGPRTREWIDFTWRYDSGLVVSGVPDVAAALALTAAQQVAIGFSCDGVFATYGNPITTCSGVGTSTLLTLPQTGTENDDHNPGPREAAQPVQRRRRHRQPVPQRTRRPGDAALRGGEPDEQGGALQFPVHVQRHALRRAADVSGVDRVRVLGRRQPR